jgi:hypothetical protein
MRKPSAEILQQIAKALRISAETLYVQAGILEDREGDHDLAGDILRDPFITEDQKQTLIKVYVSFRHENELDREAKRPASATGGAEPDGSAGAAEPRLGGGESASRGEEQASEEEEPPA